MLPQSPLHEGADQAPRAAPSDAGAPGHGSQGGLTSGPGGDHGGLGGPPSGAGQGGARGTGQAQGAGGRNLARNRASENKRKVKLTFSHLGNDKKC